jgi:hypothetical protein
LRRAELPEGHTFETDETHLLGEKNAEALEHLLPHLGHKRIKRGHRYPIKYYSHSYTRKGCSVKEILYGIEQRIKREMAIDRANDDNWNGLKRKKAGFDPHLFLIAPSALLIYLMCSLRRRAASSLILTAASFTLAQPYQCI